jgi:peptidoglycan glycosyltransferase
VNRSIVRVAVVAMLLLGALVVGTTYWQTLARAELAGRQDNAIQQVVEFTVKRGEITSRGVRLARNRAVTRKGRTLYFRRYPRGPLTAHVVGYSTAGRSRAGLERSLNDYLTGANQSLSTFVDASLDRLKGTRAEGNHVRLSLHLRAQAVALEQLGTRCGAVAALDPRTGRVLVLASSPSYNPNRVETDLDGIVSGARADCRDPAPLVNRAAWGLYPPGSIFKVVTASAALDSGRFGPRSGFYDPGYCIAYGKRVNNFDTSSPFGRINLHDALRYSVNSVFCNIGQKLGTSRILSAAERFGFYELPPLETPEAERRASGLYRNGRLYRPRLDSDVDVGRMAFGQERMLVSPLQMAMVAGTIGNGGVLMEPHVVDRIVSPKGGIVVRNTPSRLSRATTPETAAAVGAMMVSAVESGTGTASRLDGFTVGGKTGTAETGIPGVNHTWFIAYAGPPGAKPTVGIAVVVESQRSTGGRTAAPVARAVMEALLGAAPNA